MKVRGWGDEKRMSCDPHREKCIREAGMLCEVKESKLRPGGRVVWMALHIDTGNVGDEEIS